MLYQYRASHSRRVGRYWGILQCVCGVEMANVCSLYQHKRGQYRTLPVSGASTHCLSTACCIGPCSSISYISTAHCISRLRRFWWHDSTVKSNTRNRASGPHCGVCLFLEVLLGYVEPYYWAGHTTPFSTTYYGKAR
eukprot:3933238-Rhodomonas_salina.6